MTNDERDWPRNRETRASLFSGRSRSVGSFRSAHMEPVGNRLREPRLSIGAGIRDLERRTADVPVILRTNINNVIEELRPIVERARSNTGNIMSVSNGTNVTLASWLNTTHQPASNTPPIDTNPPSSSIDDVVIDMEPAPPPAAITLANPVSVNSIPSTTQSSNTTNSVPGNANNGSGDEQELTETTEVLSVSNSILLNTICKYIPFISLIFIKFVFDHIQSIFQFLVLSVAFYYYNVVVKREVASQTTRTIPMLLLYVCQIFMAIAALVYIIHNDDVMNLRLAVKPQNSFPISLGELLWSVIVTDYVLKLITVIIKAIFTLLPQKLIPSSQRGKWFLLMEATSQLYRTLVPIEPWLYFLLESYRGPQKVIGVFLSAVYMLIKGHLVKSPFKLWWMSLLKVLKNVTIGSTPTKEQVTTAGNLCSICHDEFKTPVILECQHIFCEVCVTKWLDREQTCPLCRAKIADDPSWRDGSTTYFIQLF